MDSGIYAAYTGLMARTQALDTAANNLANVGTTGFRAQRDYFGQFIAASMEQGSNSQVGQSVNAFGVLGGNHLDFDQGHIISTGNPLDIALQGDGFFGLQTDKGVIYTRNGSFSRSPEGVLETGGGGKVLDVNLNPIIIPTGAIHVATDGSISVSTPEGSAIVGRIGIFNTPDKGALLAEGADRLVISAGMKMTAMDGAVVQGSLEESNENAVHGTMQLVLVQRQAEMMQKALSAFNNDFDKVAAEELSRV